jgi:NAD(P)-dependent dehydrogenase (short-subunit alcohol dehydrogenase family)
VNPRKTAIVTGGASGIGERVAEDIVAKGGNVVVGDVNGDLGLPGWFGRRGLAQ